MDARQYVWNDHDCIWLLLNRRRCSSELTCLSELPQLCYLHADLLMNLNAKETKKQFVEFFTIFLEKGAVSGKMTSGSVVKIEIMRC